MTSSSTPLAELLADLGRALDHRPDRWPHEGRVRELRVPVASAEDVVTMKVLPGRPKDLEEKALDRDDLVRQLEGALTRVSSGTSY